MGSTLRIETVRANFLADVAKAWDGRPDLTFGELLALALTYDERADIRQLGNDAIVEAIARATRHTAPSGEPEE